jgi:hypothetical protein
MLDGFNKDLLAPVSKWIIAILGILLIKLKILDIIVISYLIHYLLLKMFMT